MSKYIYCLTVILSVLIPGWGFSNEAPVHIIPEPAQVSGRAGVFQFTASTQFILQSSDSAFDAITKKFLREFAAVSGMKLALKRTAPSPEKDNYLEIIQAKGMQPEGYHLDISPRMVRIFASSPAGIFYAFQSLRQLLPAEFVSARKISRKKWMIPCADIVDYPRFKYRGMHLDVSRHFFSIDFLKKYLDILATYKINTFHWHLTDSHGWRLEIKKYPKLTSVGAWRAQRENIPMTIAPVTGPDEPATYGGFYTQKDVKKLIQYASERFINIIPEIEMPGHATAALVAYPEYTCLNNPVPLRIPCGYPGDLKHNFCAGNDSTFLFLQGVLDEVIALFPSSYIHIGGDEVKPASWLSCPRCQQRMKNERLNSWKELQNYFTNRIDAYISSKGRRLIGWDEIMDSGISKNAAVMSWRGTKGGIDAANAGHTVVMAPYSYVYFDFYQSEPELEPDITYAALNLAKTYSFEPVPAELDEDRAVLIEGGQGCLWTENVESPARVEYMLLPRLFALSEALWSPKAAKDYRKLIDKTESQFARLDKQGISYAKSIFNVHIRPEFDSATKTIKVVLEDQTSGKHVIRYNRDGEDVSGHCPIYAGPLIFQQSGDVQAALYEQDSLMGKVSAAHFTIAPSTGSLVMLDALAKDSALQTLLARLTDGLHGSIEPYDGQWVDIRDSAFSLTVDLGKSRLLSSVGFRCLEDMVNNVLLPANIQIGVSNDNKDFHVVDEIINDSLPTEKLRHIKEYKKEDLNERGRYVRIKMLSSQQQNIENPIANAVLLDEIVVE